MPTPQLAAEDREHIARQRALSADQDRRIHEQVTIAFEAMAEAKKILEARKLMAFPFGDSVTIEHPDADE